MTEKLEILKKLMPSAVLRAMTPEARMAVSQMLIVEGLVPLTRFPFRVGRELRVKIVDGRVERIERVKGENEQQNNELYLIDNAAQLNVSIEHFQIERDGNSFYLYDRGSELGTVVEGVQVGGADGEATTVLNDGDTITIGAKQSPYVFQFILLDGFEVQSSL